MSHVLTTSFTQFMIPFPSISLPSSLAQISRHHFNPSLSKNVTLRFPFYIPFKIKILIQPSVSSFYTQAAKNQSPNRSVSLPEYPMLLSILFHIFYGIYLEHFYVQPGHCLHDLVWFCVSLQMSLLHSQLTSCIAFITALYSLDHQELHAFSGFELYFSFIHFFISSTIYVIFQMLNIHFLIQ